jgi:preprotein translocase subunit YajC
MDWLMGNAQAADSQPANTATPTADGQAPYELSAEKMMTDNLLILGLIFFIFYFILIRPQQKRIKAHQAMLQSLQKGSKVMTSGGIIGNIVKFEGDTIVVVEIAQGVKVRVARGSITEVVSDVGGESANDN